jgi:DNA polymerase III alpha subunit
MFPIRNRTHFSPLQAFAKPKELIDACVKAGYASCGLCDYGNVSGAVEFVKAAQKANVKPVLGCDFTQEDRLICFAKNKVGWHQLIKLTTKFFDKITPEDLKDSELIVISSNDAYYVTKHFYLWDEIAMNNTHYINREDKEFYDILLSLDHKEPHDLDYSFPFEWNLPEDDILRRHNEEVESLCEEYSIFEAPKLPEFKCPEGKDPHEYLTQLCRDNWGKIDQSREAEYIDRVKHELNVIKRGDLTGYFLIVWDFVKNSKDKGRLITARGSAAGSLVSFLIGVSDVDPIKHNLIFERFYDASRSYPKHISFPEYSFVDDWRAS